MHLYMWNALHNTRKMVVTIIIITTITFGKLYYRVLPSARHLYIFTSFSQNPMR